MINIASGLFVGTIQEVYPPSHELNDSQGIQYVYEVWVATEKQAILPVRCTRMDPYGGGLHQFDDLILVAGEQVIMGFPFATTTHGIILGGTRQHTEVQSEDGIMRWKNRMNEIERSISFEGLWKVQHVSESSPNGPSVSLNKDIFLINDGGPNGDADAEKSQFIEIDIPNNTIKIKAGEWTIDVDRGVTLNISDGDININCINAKVSAKEKVDIKSSSGNVTVDAGKDVTVKAKGKATVEANTVAIGPKGVAGGIITTLTQPVCYVTGIPFQGSKTVTAAT
ncbi:MAG: hypothetical protein DRI57_23790 [Deltaproteobacteria bacterium]|nr:MAG: hypothetical protein DRI57_23790 [Deltaproteobacteria bacterium]